MPETDTVAGAATTAAAETAPDEEVTIAATTAEADAQTAEGTDDRTAEQKEESRLAYELRQTKKQLDDIMKELGGYKRRDEDTRKASLSAEQRLIEERDAAVRDKTALEAQILRQKVGAELKLPPAFIDLLVGSDEESVRRHAEELQKLLPRPKVGTTTAPATAGTGAGATFKRSQLRDPQFFNANKAAILAAQREGRITND